MWDTHPVPAGCTTWSLVFRGEIVVMAEALLRIGLISNIIIQFKSLRNYVQKSIIAEEFESMFNI